MRKLSNIKPLKFLWILMALYLLNCSVDTTGLFVSALESNSIVQNDQESIIEIVVEQFLGFEQAIPECADNDMDQKATLKKAQLIDLFIIPNLDQQAYTFSGYAKKQHPIERTNHALKFYFKVPSPPPEV
ncbi:MAG: hypothetical protein V4663_02650 [Bacteroidota bacterium]